MFHDHKSYRTLTKAEISGKTMSKHDRDKQLLIRNNKKYQCDMCDNYWMSEIDVDLHRRFEHGMVLMESAQNRSNNTCWICFKKHSSEEVLLKHIKMVHYHSSPNAKRIEREVFFCHLCEHMFFNKSVLSWHIFSKHSGANDARVQLECELCLKYSRGKRLHTHCLMHNFSSYTTCPYCLENFTDGSALHKHIEIHKPVYRCDICLCDTKSYELYENHLEDHESRLSNNIINYERYFITTIKPTFLVEKWLKGIPIQGGVSVCVLCRHICTDKQSRMKHIRIHHGYLNCQKKTYMCSCGEEFFNAVLLKHHVWKMKDPHHALSEEEIKKIREDQEFDMLRTMGDEGVKNTEDSGDGLLNVNNLEYEEVKNTEDSGDGLFSVKDLVLEEEEEEEKEDDSEVMYVITVAPSP